MKVVSLENLIRSKKLKKALVSTVVMYCCLVGYKFGVHAANVSEVYSNKQSTKYKVTLTDKIYKVTNADGINIVPEQMKGNSVLFSTRGDSKVRVYVSKDEYVLVDLQDVSVIKDKEKPNILWKYKNSDKSMIFVVVEDEAGVYQVNSVGNNESARVILTDMPNRAEVSLELRESDDGIAIYDIFGNSKILYLENVALDVLKAIRNANGDNVLLKLHDSSNDIQKITYTDEEEIALVSGRDVDDTYKTESGTTKIKIKYADKGIVVPLDTDAKAPEIVRAYKSSNDRRIFLEANDVQTGIRKFSLYNSDENIENTIKQIEGTKETQLIASDIFEGTTHMCVYDGVYNKAELGLSDIAIDDKSPLVTMDYSDGSYTLNIIKDKSGIDSVSLDNIDVDVYENCPVGRFSYNFIDLDGESVVRACDGIGNVTLVTVNETLRTVKRVYKNISGSQLSIDVYDKRGIQKITDQDGNPIERFLLDTNQAKGIYKVRPNTSKIKVFYQDGKSYSLDLEELTDAVVVTDEVFKNDLVSKCKVFSKAGIREVQYKDGRNISFREDLPDDITISTTTTNENGVEVPTFVTVYDAVGNSVNINEGLA